MIKTIKEGYTFDDLLLIPNKSDVLPKDVDDKAVSAMAAALISIGGRVGTALGSGNPKNMVIEGTDKMIVLRKVGSAALIGTAPADARIGLIDFEMIKTSEELESIL